MKTIRLVFADLNGAMKGKMIPLDQFDEQARYGMPRSVLLQDIEGEENNTIDGFTPESGDKDMILRPDFQTRTAAPGNEAMEQVIVDVLDDDGSELPFAPRAILKRAADRAAAMGYEIRVATELEFYLLKNDGSLYDERELEQPYGDMNALDKLGNLLNQLMEGTATIGLKPESVLAETGPGQMEINVRPSSLVDMADRTMYFKQMIREVARSNGLQATFLAKPFAQHSGSGCHVHLSLWRDGRNMFDVQPDLLEAFAAGNARYGHELYAFFAPGPNSYRRVQLSHGYVPTSMSFGDDDRRVALRQVGEGDSRRLEHRVSGADANPYLLLACLVQAGLSGIEQSLQFDSPEIQNAVSTVFPDSLPQALNEVSRSAFATEQLGQGFVHAFCAVKHQEWSKFQAQLTTWEHTTYGSVV